MSGNDEASEAITPRIKSRLSSTAGSAHADSAPNGIDRADDVPTTQRSFVPLGRRRIQRFTSDSALADTGGPANHDPRRVGVRNRGFDESLFLRAAGQRPRQPHPYSLEAAPRAAKRKISIRLLTWLRRNGSNDGVAVRNR